ncbi:MAG: tRNA (adenosine(37)-N6)-dimethylallyltransferase MiaA [Marinilabiliales bacterium]|nr:MAG: tRNA (adenosine(37)-N6)-dimethylallyltransferase MiaA [Marinilabiliales bacterium]
MPRLIVLTGPTAVGKTELSISLAQKHNTHIISCDSRQFYREMKIGTAAPTQKELQAVPHHFIGHLSIHDYYNVSMFEQDVLKLLPELFKNADTVIMTGGSGMYIDAVAYGIDELPDADETIRQQVKAELAKNGLEGLQIWLQRLDPEHYETIDRFNPNRMRRAIEVCLQTGKPFSELRKNQSKKRDFEIEKICLVRPREELYRRINLRVDKMMEQGLEKEARSLYEFRHLNALNTVGYKELFSYFDGEISLEQAVTDIKTHSRRYAKRQLTWFKRDESYRWVDVCDDSSPLNPPKWGL